MGKVYVGDVGTEIRLNTGISLAGATTLEVRARNPLAEEFVWTAEAFEGTSVRYFTQAGDLNQPGTWFLQARVVNPDGAWLGESSKVRIYPPFG